MKWLICITECKVKEVWLGYSLCHNTHVSYGNCCTMSSQNGILVFIHRPDVLSFKQNAVSWSSLISCSFWIAMYFLFFSHFEWILETSFILKHVHSVEPWLKLDVGFQDERDHHAKSFKWCRSKVCILTVCRCDCRIRKFHDRSLSLPLYLISAFCKIRLVKENRTWLLWRCTYVCVCVCVCVCACARVCTCVFRDSFFCVYTLLPSHPPPSPPHTQSGWWKRNCVLITSKVSHRSYL